ncbi:MAG: branched-chain amino acid ABC transporter permease [Oscillospiraceae bacterium]|nr:branched-chain amino acid ABC transporter permease [Oscillospiraceae bacterium]
MILTVTTAAAVLVRGYNRAHKFVLRQEEQDGELKAIKSEQTVLVYGVLACLKGLKEQGCDGPVTEAIGRIEKHINVQAHQ